MGRSFTFNDLAEATTISKDTHRIFFNTFIKYGSTILYQKNVITPVQQYVETNDKELFNMAGFNGCVGSTDGVHVLMLQCPSWATIGHTSHKLKATARSYNVAVTGLAFYMWISLHME